jgi:hypothetical protein
LCRKILLNHDGISAPYTFLGEAEYVSHSGNIAISFIWRFREEMQAVMIRAANKSII